MDKQVFYLGFGVGLGGIHIFFGEAVVEHLIAGFAIKSIMGLGGPLAGLVEGLGLGLVDEVLIQQADLGEGHLEGVALDAYCVLAQILHIDLQLAIVVSAAVAIFYTWFGGIKAVIRRRVP